MAQQPVPQPPRPPADTARRPAPAPGDTLRRPARVDTVRTTRDSVTIAAPAAPDSAARARIDSIPTLRDSLATRTVVRDSIQPPLGRAELPTVVEVGQAYRWTRDSLFRTGSLTALDLLDRVPGLTGFRTGWLASLQTAAVLGDFRRLRVFRDGVELDPVDPRLGGVLELNDVQLWQLDEVVIERSAAEVRLHMRTWTVRSTTPATRVDIGTGDDDTNLYRGFFGRRFGNGGALQIGAQNFGTGARNRRIAGGGDAVSAFARVGWARGALSVDAFVSRLDRQRNPTFAFNTADTVLARSEARRDEGYLRIALGSPDAGPWAQAVANVLRFRLDGTGYDTRMRDTTFTGDQVARIDTVFAPDSGASRTQYLLTGGFTRWGVRLSAAERWRVFGGRNWHAPAVRASFERSWLAVSALGEHTAQDSTTRLDVTGRLQPLPWLAALGAVSRTTRDFTGDGDVTTTVARAELGARLGRLWLTGGRVIRSGGPVLPPRGLTRLVSDSFTVYAANPLPLAIVQERRANGTLASARGRLWKDVMLDVHGVAWDAAGAYRPQYQTRAEIRLETNWLRRFPSGNFGLIVAITDEYRSRTLFPVVADTTAEEPIEGFTRASNTLGALVEIRIQQATLSYQIRNALNREYQLVPGLTMPRPLSFYGVRWYFFN